METQLHFDSNEQQLGLRFREKFVTDFGVVLKVLVNVDVQQWPSCGDQVLSQRRSLLLSGSGSAQYGDRQGDRGRTPLAERIHPSEPATEQIHSS